MQDSKKATRADYRWCRRCRGWQPNTRDGSGRPHGWYSISVSVPPERGKRGTKPYVWVGDWCSAACLAASAADLIAAEGMARLAYDADPPLPPRQDRGAA